MRVNVESHEELTFSARMALVAAITAPWDVQDKGFHLADRAEADHAVATVMARQGDDVGFVAAQFVESPVLVLFSQCICLALRRQRLHATLLAHFTLTPSSVKS